ncbi:MAG: XRE family transcriptional regulator [Lachnospiraceae bacterium]|nr:XRE family transcriptional regulator [Lachnospiraceae bacterium]
MTDIDALKKCMDDSGMTITAIAEKSGMLRETLYNRLKTGDFKLSEICALSSVLRFDRDKRDEIFFKQDSELHSQT